MFSQFQFSGSVRNRWSSLILLSLKCEHIKFHFTDCVLCIEAKFFVPVGRWKPRKPPNLQNSFNLECFCKSISNYAESRKWDNCFTLIGDEHFPVIGKGTDLYFTRAARTIKLQTIIHTSKRKIRADLSAWNLFAITDRTWYIEQSGPCVRQFFSPWYRSAGKGPILTFEEFIQTVLVLTINLKKTQQVEMHFSDIIYHTLIHV